MSEISPAFLIVGYVEWKEYARKLKHKAYTLWQVTHHTVSEPGLLREKSSVCCGAGNLL